ncbi:MAG TPA: hypothetical protein DHV58_12305, partial [Erythrobacter sp.]|nr:hypothetical protein [Erythrobacter sp.]
TWTQWDGALLVRSEDERVAALQLTNRAGRFGLLGTVDPTVFLTGLPAEALGDKVALKGDIAIDNRVFDGTAIVAGRKVSLSAEGLVDLADNRADDLEMVVRVRDPAVLGDGIALRDTRLTATLDGSFDDLA